jgi:hypothetical protein
MVRLQRSYHHLFKLIVEGGIVLDSMCIIIWRRSIVISSVLPHHCIKLFFHKMMFFALDYRNNLVRGSLTLKSVR